MSCLEQKRQPGIQLNEILPTGILQLQARNHGRFHTIYHGRLLANGIAANESPKPQVHQIHLLLGIWMACKPSRGDAPIQFVIALHMHATEYPFWLGKPGSMFQMFYKEKVHVHVNVHFLSSSLNCIIRKSTCLE